MTSLREAAQAALKALEYDGLLKKRQAITALKAALAEPDGTSAQQSMQTVREGFGRTMSYLTEVFGVSRQTLYNWLSGEKAPSPEHEDKLHQLEAASHRFMELHFKPSPSQLTRTLAQGKSFLELLAAGGDGATNADKLVNLVQRGQHSRARLKALARTEENT
jgi:DNA-binding transcriptional regulator YiaG